MGVFLSHRKVWQLLASFVFDEWYLVLEDDVLLRDVAPLLRLRRRHLPARAASCALVNMGTRGHHGSEAYLLRPSQARRMLHAMLRVLCTAVVRSVRA